MSETYKRSRRQLKKSKREVIKLRRSMKDLRKQWRNSKSEEYKTHQGLIESQNAVSVRMVTSGSVDKKTAEQRKRLADKAREAQTSQRSQNSQGGGKKRRSSRSTRETKYDGFVKDMMQKLEQELAEYNVKIDSGMKDGRYSKKIHKKAKTARLDFLSNRIGGGISMAQMEERGLPV
jgi:hypothetical protein